MSNHCCERMARAVAFSCEKHETPFDCPDSVVFYDACFAEFGLIVHDGGGSYQEISYCPWCGCKLPASMRDKWFDVLEGMGFDDPIDDNIPKEFQTDEWWKSGKYT